MSDAHFDGFVELLTIFFVLYDLLDLRSDEAHIFVVFDSFSGRLGG